MAPYEKAKPGQPLNIKAALWNDVVDITRRYKERRYDRTDRIGLASRPPVVAAIENASGKTLAHFSVVKPVGVSVLRSKNESEFDFHYTIRVDVPDADTWWPVAITEQPLKDEAVGTAVLAGLARVTVDMQASDDTRAQVTASDHTKLTSCSRGGICSIVYKPQTSESTMPIGPPTPGSSSTGDQECIVWLDGPVKAQGVAKSTSSIAARSGTTPGSGTADFYSGEDGLVVIGEDITVYNWTATAVDSGTYIWVEQDDQGDWYVTAVDCA